MLKPRVLLLWVAATLALMAATAQSAPLLNGLAVHQELGKDQFIGAIYSNSLTEDPAVLMAANIPERIELKITAERGIPARRFSRMWIEGMAINNTSSTLTAQADNMVAFTSFFKARLQKNDHLVIALVPDEGVNVTLNSIELGTIANDSFFTVLLSTWLGPVPLSSTYREQLLVSGDVDQSLASRFNAISPSDSRINQVAQWNAPEPKAEPEPKAVASAKSTPKAKTESKSSAAATEIAQAAPAKAPATKIELPALSPDAAHSTSSKSSKSTSSKTASSSSRSSSSRAPVEQPEKAPGDEDDEDYVPQFTAESLLANQRYFSNMVRRVQGNIVYPRRALQRGYEGSIRVAVAVDRKGNLLSSKLIEESRYSVLNREALDAVDKAAPFPPVPAVVAGATHEFSIPINFVLQTR